MSGLFPAVRGHSAGGNSKSAFSSTASVSSSNIAPSLSSQKSLPRINGGASAPAAAAAASTQELKKKSSVSKKDIAPIDRSVAITAIPPSSSAAQLPLSSSFNSGSIHTLRTNLFFTREEDRNAACSLRIVDARLETVDSETSDTPSVWSQLNMEDVNANLSAPQTLQEHALNNLSATLRKGTRTPEQAAAEAAHRAIEVSNLVAHFPVHMGVSMVGSAPRVLLLQFENTFDPFSTTAGNSTADPNVPASNVGAGEISWKIRMPPELDSKVEHWASVSSNPTDEERYHQLVVDREIFTIRPRKGRLLPQQNQKVEIVYHPRFVGEHVLPVLFQVRGGKHFSLVLKATTVSALPASFSLLHLKEYTPQSLRPQTASQQKLLKPAEEQKETQQLQPLASTQNPFLPSASLPIFEHTFHAVPIGLSKEQAPIQTFPLVNHSDQPLAYRIYFDSFRQSKASNFNCEIISIVGSNIDGESGQEFLEGRVAPRSTGYIRFRFQPLEVKSYELPVEINVRSESSSEVTKQRLVLRGQGILPKTWALSPFPLARTSPPHQVLGLPGQLLTVSNEELHFGDTSLFSKTSRLITLRATTNQIVEFAFVHSLRVPSRRWNASLRAERQLRRVMNEEEAEELFMEDENDEDGANNNSNANNGLFDPLESVHVNFTPSSGVLEPGQSVQIRVDLHGGDQALILERDIKLYSRVLLDENGQAFSSTSQSQQSQLLSPSGGRGGNVITTGRSTGRLGATGVAGGSEEPLDTFGYNRLPSASLTLRSPISSSQPLTRKSKKVHVHVRDNRWVESVTGVGRGFAGADVRVDFPAKPALPLNTSTITRRNNSASPIENVLDHLTPSLESMQSVPSRSTWFGDAEGPTRALQQREQHVLHIYLRARILPVSSLERDENERLQHFQPLQQESNILPQQPRTEITSVGSEVSQRIFVPQVDLTTTTFTAAASQAAIQSGLVSHDGRIITDTTGAKAVEGALHDLLRAALNETTVGQSFDHLTTEPIPFFADLLGPTKSDHPHSPRSANQQHHKAESAVAGGSPFSPQSFALPNSSAHFQNVSENILNDTLFLLMVEASSTQTNFDLDTKTLPKTIVVKK